MEELCSHSHHSSSSRQLHELIADWGLIVPPQSSLTMETGTVGLPALLVSAVLPTGHIQEASTRHVHSAFEIITTVHSACKQETKSLPSQHLINLAVREEDLPFNSLNIHFYFTLAKNAMIIPFKSVQFSVMLCLMLCLMLSSTL